MSVRARLLLTLAAVGAILLVPALYAASRLAELRDIAIEQRGRHAAAFLALGRLQAAIAELNRFERSYVIAPDPALRAGVRRSLENARIQLSRLGQARYAEVVREVGTRLDSIETATGRVEALIEAGRLEDATAAFEEVAALLDGLREPLDRIAVAIDRRSIAELIEAQEISATAAATTRIAIAISLVLALALGLWTTRALTDPLLRLRRAVARVAAGRFVAPPELPYGRRDEIGDLSRSFRAMTERLAELERVRTEFVGIVTHDLKAPINVVGGYAELLEQEIYGPTTDRQREALEAISEQTRVLTGMVNQLVDLSRIEAGGLSIEPGEVDTAELFGSVERAFRALAEREGIDFAVELAPSVPPVIIADANRLRDQVLGNLLSNAFKFTAPGGRIRVRAWGRRDGLHIEVGDTGPGVPADQLRHIFDKYYQVTREARKRGAGLGLAIVKEVVDAHGGRIGVESAPGRGTTFHIVIPAPSVPLATDWRAPWRRAADGGAPRSGDAARWGRAPAASSAADRPRPPAREDARFCASDAADCADRRADRFRQLAEHVEEVLWMTSPDKKEMLYVNAQYEKTWGRSREELYANPRSWLDAVHPEDRARVAAAVPKQLEGTYDEEYRIVRPDGTIRWIRARAFPIRDEAGRVYRIAGISEDITDRKAAEAAARRLSEERAARAAAEAAAKRSRLLAEAGTVLASTLDYGATLRTVARLALPVLADWCLVDVVEDGYIRRVASTHRDPEKEKALREIERHYPVDWDSRSPVVDVLRTGKPKWLAELSPATIRAFARDERHRELIEALEPDSCIIVPFIVRERTLGAMSLFASAPRPRYGADDLAFAQDLASRAALAIDNARLHEAVVAASRAKSDFLAVMSHELRTPLAAITGYVDLMQARVAGPLPPEQAKMLDRIRVNALRQLRTIEEILAFSRTEAGRETVRPEWLELRALVREAAEPIRRLAEEKGLRLTLRLPDEPVPVLADGSKAGHIIAELLENAVKFTERGEVELTARVEDGTVVVRVRDTGVGIPPEDLQRIFEPFVQIEDVLTRERGGTGLGLTVARRFARLLGGDIAVDSTPGEGSVFEVRFPARAK